MSVFNQASILADPNRQRDHALAPRATLIPALHKDVTYRSHRESEYVTSLNGDYRFAWRMEDDIPDFFAVEYDDTEWDSIDVPSMWQYRGYGSPTYPNVEYPIPFDPPYVSCENPVGYYRRRFTAKKNGA